MLVENGSEDASWAKCLAWKENDHRINCLQSSKGVSAARNAALNVMTGQYVTFVDSDDYIADNMIEKFIETVKLYQCNMVVAGMNIIDKNNSNLWIIAEL